MTGYTYTKADFDRMLFDVDEARAGNGLDAFVWAWTPQGHKFWSDIFHEWDTASIDALPTLADMIAQYEAIHAAARFVDNAKDTADQDQDDRS